MATMLGAVVSSDQEKGDVGLGGLQVQQDRVAEGQRRPFLHVQCCGETASLTSEQGSLSGAKKCTTPINPMCFGERNIPVSF